MIAVLSSSVGVSWSCWLVLAAPGGVLLEGDMFPPQGSFVPPASWRSQRSAAPEARSCKQKLFLFQTTTSCHVHRRQEHNGLTWMSQQLNLWGHVICIKPYLWLMTVSVWVLHSFIRTFRGISILGSSGIQWRSFKGSPLFSSRKLCQISPLTQFWRILNAFGWVPLSLHPLKGEKSSFLPASSWFLVSAVGLQPIWHQVKASRWESLSLVLWVSGSWPVERLAPGERQSRWSQWAQVVPVQTRVHQVRGVSAAQQVLSPAPDPLYSSSHKAFHLGWETAGSSRFPPFCSSETCALVHGNSRLHRHQLRTCSESWECLRKKMRNVFPTVVLLDSYVVKLTNLWICMSWYNLQTGSKIKLHHVPNASEVQL